MEGTNKGKTMNKKQDAISVAAAIMGRKGGSAKTKAKSDAVRENGKKGGRPSKGIGDKRETVRAYIKAHGGLRGLSPSAKSELILQAERMAGITKIS